MNISITLTHIDSSDALDSYVREKLGALEKYMDDHQAENALLRVELGKTTEHHHKGNIFSAEGNLSVDSIHLRATIEKDDLYAAIDELKDILAEQWKSAKEKMIDHNHEPGIE